MDGGAFYVASPNYIISIEATDFYLCETIGSGGCVFINAKSGTFLRNCAMNCQATNEGQSYRCDFAMDGYSLINSTSVISCPPEFGIAWSLNAQYGYIDSSSLNLSKCRIYYSVLAIYNSLYDDFYKYTTIANNTGEIPICFAKYTTDSRSVAGDFINIVQNIKSNVRYNGLIYTHYFDVVLRNCIITKNTHNAFHHQQTGNGLSLSECIFCLNSFTSDSSICPDCTTIAFKQHICHNSSVEFTLLISPIRFMSLILCPLFLFDTKHILEHF